MHRVAVFLVLLAVAGCDSPGNEGQSESMQPEPAPLEASQADEAQPTSSLRDDLPDSLRVLTEPWFGDLDDMVERRAIRTLVVSGGPLYFYYEGKPRGMVAELLVALQQDLNASLGRRLDQIEITPMPAGRDRLIAALVSGQADLVAADLTVTDARSELVDFSEPFATGIDEIIVFAPGQGEGIETLDDLSGQAVFVRKSSSYFEHLSALNVDMQGRGKEPVQIVEVNELLRTGDILEMVNAGLAAATIVDNYKATYWSAVFPDMVVRDDLAVRSGGEIAWAFRKDSPDLAAVVNEFVRKHRQGTLIGNVLIDRYMGNLRWVRNSTSESGLDALQDLMRHFRASGSENGLEPLMLAAQAYQESGLDHSRKSPVGAVGIMQVKPSTAADRNVGIDDISEPADNIRAGAKYMRFLINRYFSDQGMGDLQQWMFALAAYNAGPAKIRRLRNEAEAEGYDPNVWLDNVEVIAARRIGRETVRYVRNVFKYYVAYRLAWDEQRRRESAIAD